MISHELIERIEGEAVLDFRSDQNGRIDEAWVRFPHFRGMEAVLEGRNALDALVITPRVCGICGHAHLQAAARMIESAYAASGEALVISPKAESIREITRIAEVIQNHFKWLYLVMLHESAKLLGKESPSFLKALYAASKINTLSALFSGQWPHSAYVLPGGVSCDPTYVEVTQALSILGEVERFVETELLGCGRDGLNVETMMGLQGDFGTLLRDFESLGLLESGKSHNRFVVLGGHAAQRTGIWEGETACADLDLVGETAAATYAPAKTTYAKNALYGGRFFEGGPLARGVVQGWELTSQLHRRFGDAALTRLAARLEETLILLDRLRSLIQNLDTAFPSYVPPPKIASLSAEGIGIVEAPRGPLIHRARIEKGEIGAYTIITPTQWNLGNGTRSAPGVAQKAMIGAASASRAILLFRTFDVCSVCTTH